MPSATQNVRIICCPNCGGDGGWDGEFSPIHYGHWTTCSYCDGVGHIEVEVEPITADDLKAMEGRSNA